MSAPQLSVVVPVRNMSSHIVACVSSIMLELQSGDELIVVDDGSTDGSGVAAERIGAQVIRNVTCVGPYRARNQAVREVGNDAVLFVDARCRARPGLIESHREMLARPGIALSCTGVEIEQTDTLAGRIAATQDFFRIDTKVTGQELDFFPTANLGVRRAALNAVGGFSPIRSGADADLCWRIQAAGLGRMAADRRLLMGWVPRDTLKALIEQNYRYGRSWVYLERAHAQAFARVRDATPATDDMPVTPVPSGSPADRLAEFGAMANNLSFRAGRLRGRWDGWRMKGAVR